MSVWQNVTPAGMTGGPLRDLFAEWLDETATMLELPALGEQTGQWRGTAGKWDELAEAAVNGSRPEFARGLTTAVSGVRAGNEAQKPAAESGEELWRLRAHYDTEAPFTETEISKL
jgi:hypothetical protein